MYHDDGGDDGDDDGRNFFPEGYPQLMYHDDGDDGEDTGEDDDDGRDFLLSGHPQLMYHDERTLSCLHHPCYTPSVPQNKQTIFLRSSMRSLFCQIYLILLLFESLCGL